MKKLKKIIIFVIIIAVFVGGGSYYYFGNKPKTTYTTADAARGKIIQTVSETGTVKAVNEINLSFLNSGRIGNIYTKVGDNVKKDQLLAELDYSSLSLKKQEVEASLEVARQNLAKLLSGATAEEIKVSQANVRQAESAYNSAQRQLSAIKNTYSNTVAQAQKSLDDLTSLDPSNVNSKRTYILNTIQNDINAITSALDYENKILTDEDTKYYLGVSNPSVLTNAQRAYDNSLPLLKVANASLSSATNNRTDENLRTAVNDVLSALNMSLSSLNYLYSVLQSSVTGGSLTQTLLDTYKATVSTHITTITTGITTVQSAHQSLIDALLNARNTLDSAKLTSDQQITTYQASVDSAYNAWQVAIAQLNKITATPNNHDISLLNAQIRQAQAGLDSVNKSIEDSMIKAPIDGTITKVDNEVGEQAVSGKSIMYMLGDSNFEIEVLVPESDIQKIAKDQKTEITLDAFGEDQKFYGTVYFIDPAETTVQDVIYYRVKINFDPRGLEIKSGMTANITITTAAKDNILMIPNRAIIDKNGSGKFVKVLSGIDQITEKKVEIGLEGDEGMVEIVSGLSEGEKVVTYTSTE